MTEVLKGKEKLNEVEKVRSNTSAELSKVRKEIKSNKVEKTKKERDVIQTCMNHLRLVVDERYYKDVMEKNTEATIKSVQYLLNNLGYNCGEIDGILVTKGKKTSRTMEAIKKFQIDAGLRIDGIPGRNTIVKLLEIYDKERDRINTARMKCDLNPTGSTTLTNEEAKKVGIYSYSRNLNRVTSLSEKQTEFLLSGTCENFSLDGLTSLNEHQTILFFSGNVKYLSLNGLTSLNEEGADSTSEEFQIQYLSLNGLKNLSEKWAESLSKVKKLELNGLTNLTDEKLELLLSGKIEYLSLNGITKLTDKQLKILLQHKTNIIVLKGIKKLTNKQVSLLAEYGVSYLGGKFVMQGDRSIFINEDILTPEQKAFLEGRGPLNIKNKSKF